MHIIIPCKSFSSGKSRLSTVLSPFERRSLCELMLKRTICIVKSVTDLDQIWVVSADDEARRVALESGVVAIPDDANDLNGALEQARRRVLLRGREKPALLILPIDLPLLSESSLQTNLAVTNEVEINSDRAGTGTNFLLLKGRAVETFSFQFGANSYQSHVTDSRVKSLTISARRDPRLEFDLDQPEDLWVVNQVYKEVWCAPLLRSIHG